MAGRHSDGAFEKARDELFSHIHRCGVLEASEDQIVEWMDDTMKFIEERYPELSKTQLGQIREVGLRFCQPVIPHGKDHSALEETDATVV